MKLLLFDVDATLIFTGGAGLRALNRAFHKLFSIESAMNGVAPHGKTDPAIVREIFHNCFPTDSVSDSEMARILDAYVVFLREEVETSGRYEVLPGIYEILEEMSVRSDVLLGLATGQYSVNQLRGCGADFAIADFRQGRDYFLRSTLMA